MRIVGIQQPDGKIDVGTLSEDGASVTGIASLQEFWSAPQRWLTQETSAATAAVASVTLVPPVPADGRVLCVGLNYLEHAREGSYRDHELPEYPTIFARWTRSLSVDGASVPVPVDEDGMDWEGEVVAWIGRTLVNATEAEALAAVVGYSTFNDLTARRAQKRTSQWSLGKNADRSGVLGPMVPAAEVRDLTVGLRICTRVNGETMQDASTRDMIYGVGLTLSHISRTLTLQPGDILATGTPAGVGYGRTPPRLLQPGDVVEVEVEGLGTIRTPVVSHLERGESDARSAAANAEPRVSPGV